MLLFVEKDIMQTMHEETLDYNAVIEQFAKMDLHVGADGKERGARRNS